MGVAPYDAVVLDDVLDYLNMAAPSLEVEAELGQYISAATSAVEMYCGPIIIREVTDYDQSGRFSVVLTHRPVVELVSVTGADGTVFDVDNFRVVAPVGLVRPVVGEAFPWGRFDVIYQAGWAATVTEVPPALALACLVIIGHLYGDQRKPTLGPQPDYGDELVAPQQVPSGFAIPYKARDLMLPFWRVSLP